MHGPFIIYFVKYVFKIVIVYFIHYVLCFMYVEFTHSDVNILTWTHEYALTFSHAYIFQTTPVYPRTSRQ